MDRIQDIRLFIRIVDLGSFSKAAQELGIGQPAATKQINRMEAQLGARLLHRTTHGVSATEIGLLYYEKCKLICLHADEASSVGTLLQTQAEGSMRISSSVAFGRRVMAPLVLEFMRMNPQLQIELLCDDRYVNLVEQGVDVAVRLGKLADSTLGAAWLGVNPWVLVASGSYLKEHGTPRKPEDLARHDVLIYSSVQGDERWHFTGRAGEQRPGHRRAAALCGAALAGRWRGGEPAGCLAVAAAGGACGLPLATPGAGQGAPVHQLDAGAVWT